MAKNLHIQVLSSMSSSYDSVFASYRTLATLTAESHDAVAVLVTLLCLTYAYWHYFFPNIKVPNDYWYQVPQANGSSIGAGQKRADSRSISSAFENQVSLRFQEMQQYRYLQSVIEP